MSQTREKLEEMGFRILDAVRTELLLSMRFMAPALNSLGFKMDLATSYAGTDAAYIRFNPGFLLQTYVERPRIMNRMYVHMLVHCLSATCLRRRRGRTRSCGICAAISRRNRWWIP